MISQQAWFILQTGTWDVTEFANLTKISINYKHLGRTKALTGKRKKQSLKTRPYNAATSLRKPESSESL